MENNFIQMAASAGHAVHYRLSAAVFHQWLQEYCPLKCQLSLTCRFCLYQRCQIAAPRRPKNFFFYLKVQSFRLIMENNFIQMPASAGHAVAYTIGSNFKHIIEYVQLYFTNGFTNIVL